MDRSRRPRPGPAPRIQLPWFERSRLANGLTTLAVRHDNLPEISARVVIPHGAAEDPEGLAGTSVMVARMLTEGTEQRSAREIAEALGYLGARFGLDLSQDATVIKLEFLSHVFDEALDLLAEIVTRPAFDGGEVARLKDERLDEIASALDEPRVVANLRLAEAIYGDHPYGIREGGDEESVRAIEPATLGEFHRRFYRPAGTTLVLVGDVPADDELHDRLERAFGAWQGDRTAARQLPQPDAVGERRVWAVDWAGPQSEVRIGGLGVERNTEDYFGALLMNAVLGGLFSSRINLNLREDKGWTYGAYSRFDARKRRGPYFIATAVDAQATAPAVGEILGELDGMRRNPPTDEELELARNALTFSLPRLFETVGQVSARIAQQVTYELPDDYWEIYRDRIQKMGRAEVLALAERLLDPDQVAVVVVGPLERFRDELNAFGQVEVRDIRGEPVSEQLSEG